MVIHIQLADTNKKKPGLWRIPVSLSRCCHKEKRSLAAEMAVRPTCIGSKTGAKQIFEQVPDGNLAIPLENLVMKRLLFLADSFGPGRISSKSFYSPYRWVAKTCPTIPPVSASRRRGFPDRYGAEFWAKKNLVMGGTRFLS